MSSLEDLDLLGLRLTSAYSICITGEWKPLRLTPWRMANLTDKTPTDKHGIKIGRAHV